jgi:hypothetical protein
MLGFEADARIRTADPFITSEVLYQLSYVGACRRILLWSPGGRKAVSSRCYGLLGNRKFAMFGNGLGVNPVL